MSDLVTKTLEKFTNDQLVYMLIGAFLEFVFFIWWFQVPEVFRTLLKRTRRIEQNQAVLSENQKAIASLVSEIARKNGVSLTNVLLKSVDLRSDEDGEDF